jgi:hypothetical protein
LFGSQHKLGQGPNEPFFNRAYPKLDFRARLPIKMEKNKGPKIFTYYFLRAFFDRTFLAAYFKGHYNWTKRT